VRNYECIFLITLVYGLLPGNVSGLTVHTQAAERDTCPDECVSNIDTQTIG
jgi:hypothetical protein